MSLRSRLYNKLEVTDFGMDCGEQLKAVMRWYPNKRFYKRKSSKSGKEIISVYSEDAVCPVYSHDEWYAQDWDSPFLEVNVAVPFFEQFALLQKKAPVVALLSNLQENAEYCQDCEGLKDCYLVFDALNDRDVLYSARIYDSSDCVDCYWVMDSQLLYDCVYMFSSYNCRYSFHCQQASDSAFLFNCRNVQNSFMCSNLRNKQYCVRNKQLTKEEYETFMKTVDLADYGTVMELKKELREMVGRAPIPPGFLENCEDSTGNWLKNCSHVDMVFESFDMKDSYNNFQCAKARDMVGSFMCNDRVEKCFQCVATGIESYEVKNCAFTWHSAFMEYCYLCLNSKNCFGCIGLKNKEYHIFNKPYSKEEYFEVVEKLKAAMKERGEYGKFFPAELSPFPYEDTIAYDLFEGSGESAFEQEYEAGVKVKGEKSAEMVGGGDELEAAAGRVVKCVVSGATFSYNAQELAFYKEHGIPLPRVCMAVRYRQRMELMDTGFTLLPVTLENGEKVSTTFAHPHKKNIVSQKVYEASLE